MLRDKRILLIISGGIAAYKCLELIRRLRERGATLVPAAGGRVAHSDDGSMRMTTWSS